MGSNSLSLLDEALALGERELALLTAGQIDEAGLMANDRSSLMSRAFENSAGVELEVLQGKLEQLQSLQGRLTVEARQLHDSVRRELLRTRSEGKRLEGYGKAARRTPMISTFMSKRS